MAPAVHPDKGNSTAVFQHLSHLKALLDANVSVCVAGGATTLCIGEHRGVLEGGRYERIRRYGHNGEH